MNVSWTRRRARRTLPARLAGRMRVSLPPDRKMCRRLLDKNDRVRISDIVTDSYSFEFETFYSRMFLGRVEWMEVKEGQGVVAI